MPDPDLPPRYPYLTSAAALAVVAGFIGLTAGLLRWRPGPDRGATVPAAGGPADPAAKGSVTQTAAAAAPK